MGSPPFLGTWEDPIGRGLKKDPTRERERGCYWEKTAHSTQFPYLNKFCKIREQAIVKF